MKTEGSPKAQRSAGRLAAVQAVYQMIANEQRAASVLTDFKSHPPVNGQDGEAMITPDTALLSAITQGVETRRDDVEQLIAGTQKRRSSTGDEGAYAPNEPLLHSLLLCGAYELLAHHDTDAPVIISDYLEVAHAFFDQGESKLVNGVLDNISKGVRDSE